MNSGFNKFQAYNTKLREIEDKVLGDENEFRCGKSRMWQTEVKEVS